MVPICVSFLPCLSAEIDTIFFVIMLNSTKFELPEKGLGNLQSIAIVLIWLLIEVLGNALLIGLIQFERLGGDPLKRRITDQV